MGRSRGWSCSLSATHRGAMGGHRRRTGEKRQFGVKNKENWDGKNKGRNSIKDLQGVFLVKTSLMMISDRNRKVLFLLGSLL